MKYQMANDDKLDCKSISGTEAAGSFQRGMISWATGLWMRARAVTSTESVNRHCVAKPQACEAQP